LCPIIPLNTPMHADDPSKCRLIKRETDLNRLDTILIVDAIIPFAASCKISFDSIKHTLLLVSYR